MKNQKEVVELKGHWSASLTAAVSHCKAVGDVRYYLNGVYVAPHPDKGVIIAATNGHLCAIAHDENGYISRPAIFSFESKFLAAHKSSRKEPFGPKVIETDGTIMYMTYEGRHSGYQPVTYGDFGKKNIGVLVKAMQPVDEIDGKYPDLNRILPADLYESAPALSINPKYAGYPEKLIKTVFPYVKNCAIRISHIKDKDAGGKSYAKYGPMFVEFDQCRELVMIIMPMHFYNDSNHSVPGWVKQMKGAEQ